MPGPQDSPSQGSRSEGSPALFPDCALEECLTRSTSIVRDMLELKWAREEPSPQGIAPLLLENGAEGTSVEVVSPLPPAPKDMVLDTIDDAVNSLRTGRDIEGLRDRIAQLVTNQESRAELVSNLALTHDFDRLTKFLRARASLEDILLTASIDRTLTPTQSLAFLKITQEQSEVILNRVRAGATNIQDLAALLNKANYALQLQDAELQKKFANTSPQGREIIRRLAHRLNKVASAKAATVEATIVED